VDRAAFEQLHRRFAPAVHGVLLALRPRGDVEDLVQEVFLAAWRSLATLRDESSFGPWLLAIARNAAKQAPAGEPRASHELRRVPMPDDVAASSNGEARAASEAREILELVRALPEAYRETLVLRLVEGWSGPQIAAATGLTHGSVRVNLHRGMELLREKLRAEGYA
jgi:RNA polymerase sigma-70 factor (ECF subfamily)